MNYGGITKFTSVKLLLDKCTNAFDVSLFQELSLYQFPLTDTLMHLAVGSHLSPA